MRKVFIIILAFFVVGSVFANPITQKQAEKVASNFYQFKAMGIKADVAINSVTANDYKGLTTFYTVRFKNGGFVIVSADDAVKPILAYSVDGNMPQNITNPEVKWWFGEYSKQIEYIVQNKLDNSETLKKWNNIRTKTFTKRTNAVTPLLTTTWDQDTGYNTDCPGGYTGCVATAMAQIMNYHEYPVTGVNWHTYNHPTYGEQKVFFASVNYDWANMPDDSGNPAVATLMRHCGVAVDMDYSTAGSGARSADVPMALANYFAYDQGVDYVEKAEYSTDAEWITLLKTELDVSRPILYSGSGTGGGHAFVFDGYDATDNFHVNWGWSGNSNGYFAIGALNAGGYSFNEDNAAVIGIQQPTGSSKFLWVNKSSGLLATSAYPGYIDAVDENVAWCIARDGSGGGADYRIYSRTTNGGATWEGKDILNLGGTAFSMIQGLNENIAYISMWGTGTDNHVLRTTDGGENWQSVLQGAGSSSFFNVVHFFNENDGFSQGDPEGGEYELYTTTDGGDNWTRVDGANIPNPSSGEYGITGHYTAIADTIWYTTNKGRIYKSEDKGYTWNVYTVYTGSNGTYIEVAFSDNAQNGLAHVTETSGNSVVGNKLYNTTDGGETWTEIASPAGNFYTSGISSVPGVNNMFISVGADSQTPAMGISYSIDGGITWVDYPQYYQNYQVITVDMVSETKGFAGTFMGSYSGGMFVLGEPKTMIADFSADATTSCISTNITFTNNSIGTNITSYTWDFGVDATPATASTEGPHVVTYSSGGNKTVVLTISDGTNSDIHTINDYVNISEAAPNEIDAITGDASVSLNETHTYTVPAQANCTFNWSASETNWTIVSDSPNSNDVDYKFGGFGTVPEGTITVQAVNGCGSNSPTSITINAADGINSLDNLVTISPNPAKDMANIVSNENIINISVKNIAGQMVLNTNVNSKSHKVDLSNLAKGVYIFTIKTEKQTITRKVIVE